jgi:arylsulfatase A-like enzyme
VNNYFLLKSQRQVFLPQEKPNIVFIVLGSARRDLFGAYGSSKNLTPFIDSLAKNSLVMMDYYPFGCGSAQVHVSLFLGKHSTRHREKFLE